MSVGKEELRKEIDGEPFFGEALGFFFKCITDFEGITVLDAGCGSGALSVYMALCGARVIGVDINKASLARAQELSMRHGTQGRCVFTCSSMEHICVDDGSIDLIFSKSTLQYVDRTATLKEFSRVLRKGGDMVLVENLPYNPLINLFRLVRRIRARSPIQIAYLKSIKGYITFSEIKEIKTHFKDCAQSEFNLFRTFALAIMRYLGDGKLSRVVDENVKALDRAVIGSIPFANRLAWIEVLVCRGKK